MMLLSPEFFGTTVAAILTLMVYSYLLRDNPLSRLAEHLLVATSVAYALVAVVHYVLLPQLLLPMAADASARPDLLIPLILGILLLTKAVPRGAALGVGNLSLGYLVGIGLAISMGGALIGTLIPQTAATILPVLPSASLSPLGAFNNFVIIGGTLLVLSSFMFITRRRAETQPGSSEPTNSTGGPWRRAGRLFLMMTFGAIFGSTTLTYMGLLVGRLDFLINDWLRTLFPF